MAEKLRAAIYTRISDDRTGEQAGVTRQREDCQEFCERRGWEVVRTYEDNDISASGYTRKKRPAYRELIEAAEAGTIDVIVAWHTDRLYRRPRELEDLIDLSERLGDRLKIATCHGDFDLSTSDGRAMARVIVTMAAKASDDTSRRIRRQQLELAKTGAPRNTTRPFGYEPDGVTIRESEAQLLRDAAERILAGGSLTGIARDWNAQEVLTPAKNRPWQATTVKRVLTNPRHAGLRVHRGEVIGPATWPPILDRQTHERLVKIFNDPSRKVGPRRRALLTGLVRCGRCDHLMKRAVGNGHKVWRCRRDPGAPNCGRMTVKATALEELVTQAAFHALDTPELAKQLDEKNDQPSVDTSKIAELEARQHELAEMWAGGEISRPEWLTARTSIEKELEQLRRQLQGTESRAAIAPFIGEGGALRAAWPDLPLDRKRAILAAVIDRVVVHKPERPAPRVQTDRVEISWRA